MTKETYVEKWTFTSRVFRKILETSNAATEGPWFLESDESGTEVAWTYLACGDMDALSPNYVPGHFTVSDLTRGPENKTEHANLRFIAASREIVPLTISALLADLPNFETAAYADENPEDAWLQIIRIDKMYKLAVALASSVEV